MDAVEYVKTLHRLCKSKDGCFGCILDSEDGCIAAANRYEGYENAVPIVEQWEKEHPINTRQSEFLRMFPNADLCRDVIDISPCSIEKEMRKCCGDRNCGECKRTYWLTEVTDNDNVY